MYHCQALTKKGTMCKNIFNDENLKYCHTHQIIKQKKTYELPLQKTITVDYHAQQKKTYELPLQKMNTDDFHVTLGLDVDVSTKRYKIISYLGEGTFGKCVECWDRQTKTFCAVKIINGGKKNTKDGIIEIQIMEEMLKNDKFDEYNFIKIKNVLYTDTNHICIVMPVHGKSLYKSIEQKEEFNLNTISHIAHQIAKTLDFMHNNLHMIHTDLKTENIIFDKSSDHNFKIRICDFGGVVVVKEDTKFNYCAQTQNFRAPEIIMNREWSYKIDMWSIGCILFELYSKHLLFKTTSLSILKEKINNNLFPCFKTLRKKIKNDLFYDLLSKLLCCDIDTRMSAKQMLEHDFCKYKSV